MTVCVINSLDLDIISEKEREREGTRKELKGEKTQHSRIVLLSWDMLQQKPCEAQHCCVPL